MIEDKVLQVNLSKIFENFKFICIEAFKKVVIFIVAGLVTLIILALITFMLMVILDELNLHSIAYIIPLVIVGLYTVLFLYFMPFLIFKLKRIQNPNFIFKDFLRILVFSLKIKIKNYFKAFLFMILVYIVSMGIGIFLIILFKGNISIVISTLITNILPTIFMVSIASSIEEEN